MANTARRNPAGVVTTSKFCFMHKPRCSKKTKFVIKMKSKAKAYKSCAVPLCENTSIATPNKVFVNVPIKKEIRLKWLKLAWRDPDELSKYTTLYFCEDHFDLPNDMENYMQYHVMGSVSQVRMKVGCMPKKFKCQPDRKKLTSDTTKGPCEVKKQRMKTLDMCEKRFEENSIVTEQSEETASGSSVQHNVEEVPQLSPRVLDTSIQLKAFKAFRSKTNETQLPNDMNNYMQYCILGTVSQVRMIPGCTPSEFECQPDRKRRTCGGKERPYILKKNRMKAVEECLNKSEIKTTSCSSLQDTSNINFHTVEEHAEEILCKQEEKSVQITTLNREIKEDFENKSLDDDILNLHTSIDIKQDIEDIDASVASLSSASSSRTNSACGSPTRESRIETFTEYEPQTTKDVTVMKGEPGSPLPDGFIHSTRDILTEIAADVYQQHTKKQSQQNITLTQIRHANCERQRKYREKQRAAKLKARGSSEVQQYKRRPLTNAERLRRHRQLLREKKQQQQLEEQQAQKLVTQKNVDHNSHQDALEDVHSSDPSHSTDSCSQTITTPQREINKDLDLHESHEDDILDLHVEIRQEDIDDIEASIPIPTYLILKKKKDQHIDSSEANLSSASRSQTNSACSSPTRESRIETFIEYVPQTTIDVTVKKEEPVSPPPDVSIHSHAADSPEEQAIAIKLRKKMEMLSHNEEIIKCRREEISILEKNNKQLLADIKYLQDVSKKKC